MGAKSRAGYGRVVLDSSVLLTVPSGACFTLVSLVLTVPSLCTLVRSVWDTSLAQPLNKDANASPAIAAPSSPVLISFLIEEFRRQTKS